MSFNLKKINGTVSLNSFTEKSLMESKHISSYGFATVLFKELESIMKPRISCYYRNTWVDLSYISHYRKWKYILTLENDRPSNTFVLT